jgi:hypothetical protein
MDAAVGEGIGDGRRKIIARALPDQRSIVHQTIDQEFGQRLCWGV